VPARLAIVAAGCCVIVCILVCASLHGVG